MKIISLKESQYNRLFEEITSFAYSRLGDKQNSVPDEISTSEISSQANPGEGGVVGTADNFQSTQTNPARRWGNRF